MAKMRENRLKGIKRQKRVLKMATKCQKEFKRTQTGGNWLKKGQKWIKSRKRTKIVKKSKKGPRGVKRG